MDQRVRREQSNKRQGQKHINGDRIEEARDLRLFHLGRHMIAIRFVMFAVGRHMGRKVQRTVRREIKRDPGEGRDEQYDGNELQPQQNCWAMLPTCRHIRNYAKT